MSRTMHPARPMPTPEPIKPPMCESCRKYPAIGIYEWRERRLRPVREYTEHEKRMAHMEFEPRQDRPYRTRRQQLCASCGLDTASKRTFVAGGFSVRRTFGVHIVHSFGGAS